MIDRINNTSIYNNTTDRHCIMFHYRNNHYVSHCNVIKNTHNRKGDNDGIVVNYASRSIKTNNSATGIFVFMYMKVFDE